MLEKKEGVAQEEVGVRSVEGAVGDRKRTDSGRVVSAPDPELIERPRRRRFSAEYKLGVLEAADACSRPGEIGALLRREGLYTSSLTAWRKQRKTGTLKALSKRRGRSPADPRDSQIAKLRRRAERAEAELATARKVIEVQGNVSALLGALLEPRGAKPDASTE